MGPEQALADEYEVLLIDDICSFLTPRLVRSLRELGREIVGVYEPGDAPDAKRLLLDCGITDVIEADAAAEEFVAVSSSLLMHRRPALVAVAKAPRSFRIGVIGPIGGVGVTEVAIALASSLSQSRSTLLIDLDLLGPSVAQRLDLPVHPNLMTAIDSAHHSGDIAEGVLGLGQLGVVVGLAGPAGHEIPSAEIGALIDEIEVTGYEVIVADLGATRLERLGSLNLSALIVVGVANPVGLARLVRSVQGISGQFDDSDVVAVVNRVESGRRSLEIRSEMARLMPDTPIVLLPDDRGMERAAWDGARLTRGPFARAVGRIATLIEGAIR
jgi:MinD-like ATPase involved in chromosome partitioning or flagellar assembly